MNSNLTKLLCAFTVYFLVASCVIFVGAPIEEESNTFEPTGFGSRNILLYYGNGGAAPGAFGDGLADFYDLQARYDSQGCPTTYTGIWPLDLNDYRVIFLILPGYRDDSGTYFFTNDQVNQVVDFLMNGGRLVVQGEHSGGFGLDTVNHLLGRLGLWIRQNNDDVLPDIEPAATDIIYDQLTEGVAALDMDGSGVSSVTVGPTASGLVRDRNMLDVVAVDFYPGAPPRPGGEILLYGDTQVLDDYQLQDKDGDGPYDNFVFADNIGMCLGNKPPLADANGPYVGNEDTPITFDGTGSYDPDGRITIYQVWHNGDYNPDPNSLHNLITELNARTSHLAVHGGFARLGVDDISDAAMLYITGHDPFSFSDSERTALKAYLESGGLLFADDCDHWLDVGGFETNFRNEMQIILGQTLTDLPTDHPVFSSFYVTGGTLPTQWNNEPLQGIDIGGRTAVIYSDMDYGCGWENVALPETIENSYRMGINVAVFALMSGGQSLTYEWDFDNDGQYDDGTGPNPTYTFNDDYNGSIGLRVTDVAGLTDTDTAHVTVHNVDPTVTIDSALANVEIGLRVAGRKWNIVSMDLYEDGTLLGSVSIERLPGSLDDQMAWITITLDLTKTYDATVFFIPKDPPETGGNPVWIYVEFEDGGMAEIHHTFNVQQS
ncbi:MAG: DUF4159 domain-containing protein, partial [Methanobacteriota archaeon]